MIPDQNLQWDFPALANALHRMMDEIDSSLHESLAEAMRKNHVRCYMILKGLDKKYKIGLCQFLHRWLHERIKYVSPHPWQIQPKEDNAAARKRMQQLNTIIVKYLYKNHISTQNALLQLAQLKNDFEVMRPLLSEHLIKFKELTDKGGPVNFQRLVYLAATELELKRQRWTNDHWLAIRDLKFVCNPKLIMQHWVNHPDEAKIYAVLTEAFEPADKLSAREALGMYDGTSRKQTLGRLRKSWHDHTKTESAWLKSVEKAKLYAKKLR